VHGGHGGSECALYRVVSDWHFQAGGVFLGPGGGSDAGCHPMKATTSTYFGLYVRHSIGLFTPGRFAQRPS